ncbi:MAG: Lipoteichoic acid synthase LtaS Type IIIa [Candidatus Ozemobacter sibiricus]|jgi:phosphoglycerol transferase MdoB-like AlkP superfamily enzyme|uniref:Lipoteichoic acid synthase LtaS Type IIIa n=1 Tax=Candidatus Ozemobacter sibiricus TaxID=2268124 RepID=A0A367ZLP3_9BACT|nr:MAG: Lipoteichoic acid synthase LtaS Type IIIa [Candidatus Ozemobacter sibiricus]
MVTLMFFVQGLLWWFFWAALGVPLFGLGIPHPLYLIGCVVVLLLYVLIMYPIAWSRLRESLAVGWSVALGIGLYALVLFVRFYETPPSIDLILFGGNIWEIRDSILALSQAADACFFLPLPIWGLVRLMRSCRQRLAEADAFFLNLPFQRLFLFFLVAVAVWGYGLSFLAPAEVEPRFWLLASNPVLYFGWQGLKLVGRPLFDPALDPANRPRIIKGLTTWAEERRRLSRHIPWKTSPPASRPNLIIIQMESLLAEVLGMRIAGEAVAPTLERLASEGVLLTEFHSQVIATSDSEFCFLTSLYPLSDEYPHLTRSRLAYPALPKLLGKCGYSTYYLNPGKWTFWNARQMVEAFGFQQARFRETIIDGEEESFRWVLDDRLLVELGKDLQRLPEPFLAMVLTMNTHYPYDPPGISHAFPPIASPPMETEARKYANAVRSFDDALRRFLEDLRRQGILDRSMLLLFGDHPAILEKNTKRFKAMFAGVPEGDPLARLANSKVVCILYGPAWLQPATIGKLCSQVDLAPTILDLLGLDLPLTMLGESVFIDRPGWVAHKMNVGMTPDHWLGGFSERECRFRRAFEVGTLRPVEAPAAMASATQRIGWSMAMIRQGWFPTWEETGAMTGSTASKE